MDPLKCVWWTELAHCEGKKWYIKSILDKDLGVFHVMITDLIVAYQDLCDRTELQARIKELNPRLEGEPFDLAKNAITLIKRLSPTDEERTNDVLHLECAHTIQGRLPFKWKFCGTKCDPEIFFTHVTSVLIKLITQYERRESQLVTLLEAKDDQIYRYAASSNLKVPLMSSRFCVSEWSINDVNSKECQESFKEGCKLPTAFAQGSVPYSEMLNTCDELDVRKDHTVPKPDDRSNENPSLSDSSLLDTQPLEDLETNQIYYPEPEPQITTKKNKKRKKDLRL